MQLCFIFYGGKVAQGDLIMTAKTFLNLNDNWEPEEVRLDPCVYLQKLKLKDIK